MHTPDCEHCTARAIGVDEDGAFTCGDAATCSAAVGPLPAVIEASDDDGNDGCD